MLIEITHHKVSVKCKSTFVIKRESEKIQITTSPVKILIYKPILVEKSVGLSCLWNVYSIAVNNILTIITVS